jgi:hypothetical protein
VLFLSPDLILREIEEIKEEILGFKKIKIFRI